MNKSIKSKIIKLISITLGMVAGYIPIVFPSEQIILATFIIGQFAIVILVYKIIKDSVNKMLEVIHSKKDK